MNYSTNTLLAFSALIGIACGDRAKNDGSYTVGNSYHGSMWVLGTNGVYIFSTDGTQELHHMPAADMCPLNSRSGVVECGFREVISDGERNVWATDSSDDTLKVFSIEKGMLAASLPTCNFPWDLDYNPLRQEMWVQCWSPDDESEGGTDTGHLDVYSTSSITTDFEQVISGVLKDHGHGTVILDSTLPNTAYAATLDQEELFEIDLNTKSVVANYTVPFVSGVFRMNYSHANKHLYIRAYVCCSCGVEGADVETCSTRGTPRNVDVVTGPNQMTNVTGTCGHGCEGTPADSIGVYEFDTVSKNFITSHNSPSKNGAQAFVSTNGRFVFLLGNDGGNKISVLEAINNGSPSPEINVITTGFDTDGAYDGDVGISDVVFIENGKYNIAVIASTVANFVVVVEMGPIADGTFKSKDHQHTIWLEEDKDKDSTSGHGRGARRNCAYAGGNYLWCNASAEDKVQVIKLSPKLSNSRVTQTIMEVPSRLVVHVENENTIAAEKMTRGLICDWEKSALIKEADKDKKLCLTKKATKKCNNKYKNEMKKIDEMYDECNEDDY